MGFFDIFRRKKEITPKELVAMMDDIRKKYAFVEGIKDDKIRYPQAKALAENINLVSRIVEDTLNKVQNKLKDVRGLSDFLATKEADSTGYGNLKKGEEFLLFCKKELEDMLNGLMGSSSQKRDESEGPSNG